MKGDYTGDEPAGHIERDGDPPQMKGDYTGDRFVDLSRNDGDHPQMKGDYTFPEPEAPS